MTTIAEPRRQLTAVADLIAAGLWLRRAAEAERDRWALWLAPLLGAGVLTYFALPVEPPAWLGPALLATVSAAAVAMRLRGWNVPLLVAAAAVVVGFAAGQMRTATTGTPILGRSMGPVMVTGQVVEVAPLPGRAGRMLLEVASIERLPPAQTPRLIRIRVSGDIALLEPGDRVAYLAELSPPPLPAAPGAFDYQRQAWFDGIGAIGFALGGPTLHEPAATWERGWWNWWTALRQDATRRIQTALPGPEGAMAAALMTGYQKRPSFGRCSTVPCVA